jgi:hypothetical protein
MAPKIPGADVILQSFVYENQLAAQWSQLSPPDREGRAGDGILDEISRHKSSCEKIYINNLVTACGSYKAGSGGSSHLKQFLQSQAELLLLNLFFLYL